ncbi:MAG: glycosyltransferase family 2 protein [Blastochloris sp.]|nr:glycosyltransferase family 2 protein [Blastochloris sp.]
MLTVSVPPPSASPAAAGLSIIVPVYNEAANLPVLHARLLALTAEFARRRGLKVEIVYVDDGSRDTSLAVLRTLPSDGADLQVLSFSRNFGKEAALMAGLDFARNGALLFMDADGQHPPEMVEKLVSLWLDEGFDVAYTAKAHRRNEPALRRFFVLTFYYLLNRGARHPIPPDAGDFRLLSPRAAAALRQLPERNRFFKGLSSWIGFRQICVPYEPAQRLHGMSSWSFQSLVGLSIEGLTSFSVAPLRVASVFGFLFAGSALVYGAWIVLEKLIWGITVPGYPSLMVAVSIIGGTQLIMIGVLGEYIAKILSELKGRPIYFLAEHEVRDAAPAPRDTVS